MVMAADGDTKPIDLIPRIVLWVHPRSTSTAFERSIRQLSRVKVLHEPFFDSYYDGPERQESRGVEGYEVNPEATYESADDKLCQDYPGYDYMFCKSMAFEVRGRYKKYVEGRFTNFRHTFLIRNPMKSAPSQYKARKTNGFPMDVPELGLKELYELYEVVKKASNSASPPIVIDSDDLLANPKLVMKRYCQVAGLPFDECMLHWSSQDEHDSPLHDCGTEMFPSKCKHWHHTALASTGFIELQPSSQATPSHQSAINDLPKEWQDAVMEALPLYNALHSARLSGTF